MQADHDDDETFKPHADVHDDRDDEDDDQVLADLLNQKNCGTITLQLIIMIQ